MNNFESIYPYQFPIKDCQQYLAEQKVKYSINDLKLNEATRETVNFTQIAATTAF